MTDLSIIIISYNTSVITLNCLKSIYASLKSSEISTEIIVLDNNSDDSSVVDLQQFQKQNESKLISLILIQSKENVGFAKGNNIAIKETQGKTILLLNSDIEVIDGAIPDLYTYFTTQNKFSFVGGKLLNRDFSDQASAASFYTIPVVIGALFLRGDYLHLTRYSPSSKRQVDWVSGACIMTTRESYDAVSGFDENIFMYMDEVDLLFRARKQGLLTGFYPDARFVHLGSASSNGKTQPILQVYRGFLYFYKKHCGKTETVFLKILLYLKAAVAYIIGKITNNNYLISTYEQALTIVAQN